MTDKRIDFLGVPIDALTMEETIDCIVKHIHERRPAQHMAINPAKIMHMLSDPEIAKTVRNCEVITADGMGVVWASRLFSDTLPCRVTGIDLMDHLLSKSAEIGLKPYFLGAKQEILEQTVAHYTARFPNLQFAGHRNGYFIVLGRWCLDECAILYGGWWQFRWVAGKVSRAPDWMQRFGLESHRVTMGRMVGR